MIKRLLIANRGEIAVRIIRTAHEMGIEAVAVYSTSDSESLHVRMADRAVCIGPPAAKDSYLDAASLVTAALRTGCDAIHPGVGFLSENAHFAGMVEEAGLLFIGPAPSHLALLGDKVAARDAAKKSGLPITPGTEGTVSDLSEAKAAVKKLGFPVIIKAAAGGGGKGMRIVREEGALSENLAMAAREAEASFGDKRVFIERYVENPRHVELQVLSDGASKVSILGERDCTVQRKHQKLIEESPSPSVTDRMRKAMVKGAMHLFSDLKFRGAGTVEFLVDGDEFYFMEVNARVQVEHPVTELVAHCDIIRQMILAACEGRLEIDGGLQKLEGWAVECRINALGAGRVTTLETPGGPGVRFDSFLYNGYSVTPFYDAMLAKLIVHAEDRPRALKRMARALSEVAIGPIATNIEEQKRIIAHPVFIQGDFGTSFYEEYFGNNEM
jgi:acetyl-CoA carboxylase biotin carboxylase subunit